jgi:hypothetical protein
MNATPPKVLFVYYTYSQQTRSVVEAMADVLRARGCDVTLAEIEYTDPRYAGRFSRFPFPRVYVDLFSMFPAQLRRATGEFRISDEARDGDYDFICIGSPTWWLTTCMPVRSFMKSDLAKRLLNGKRFSAFAVCRRYWRNNLHTIRNLGTGHGGKFVSGTHFVHAGGQVMSMLSLLSFLGTGADRERYLGVKIPSAGLKPDYLRQAQDFAGGIADSLALGHESQIAQKVA